MTQRLRAVSALLGAACLFLALILLIVVIGTQSTDRLTACLVVTGMGVALLAAGVVGRTRRSTALLVFALDLIGEILLGLAPLVTIAFALTASDHKVAGAALVLVGVGGVGLLARLPHYRQRRKAKGTTE